MKDIEKSQSRTQLLQKISRDLDHYVKSSNQSPETQILREKLMETKNVLWRMHDELTKRGNKIQQLHFVMERAIPIIEGSVYLEVIRREMVQVLEQHWNRNLPRNAVKDSIHDLIVDKFEDLFDRIDRNKHGKSLNKSIRL
jgi:hypothetical protein